MEGMLDVSNQLIEAGLLATGIHVQSKGFCLSTLVCKLYRQIYEATSHNSLDINSRIC